MKPSHRLPPPAPPISSQDQDTPKPQLLSSRVAEAKEHIPKNKVATVSSAFNGKSQASLLDEYKAPIRAPPPLTLSKSTRVILNVTKPDPPQMTSSPDRALRKKRTGGDGSGSIVYRPQRKLFGNIQQSFTQIFTPPEEVHTPTAPVTAPPSNTVDEKDPPPPPPPDDDSDTHNRASNATDSDTTPSEDEYVAEDISRDLRRKKSLEVYVNAAQAAAVKTLTSTGKHTFEDTAANNIAGEIDSDPDSDLPEPPPPPEDDDSSVDEDDGLPKEAGNLSRDSITSLNSESVDASNHVSDSKSNIPPAPKKSKLPSIPAVISNVTGKRGSFFSRSRKASLTLAAVPEAKPSDKNSEEAHDTIVVKPIATLLPLANPIVETIDNSEVKEEDKRLKAEAAFSELIATEKSYIEGLTNLYRHFVLGLRAHNEVKTETSILSEDEIKKCFLNVTEISVLSNRLLTDLKKLRRDTVDFVEVGKLFTKYTPFLRIYSNYTESFDSATALLRHLIKNKPNLASFIKVREYCVGSKLDQLRTLPIQRIPRYLLMLKEMRKQFEKDTDVAKSLDNAIEDVFKVAEHVDESIEMASSRKEVFFLQESVFKHRVNLVTSSRYCVRYSFLTKVSQSSKKKNVAKEYLFILFDDCLCYALMSRDKKSASMKHVIPLDGIEIGSIEDNVDYQNCFLIKSSYKAIFVSAGSAQIKEGWIHDLKNHAQILRSNYATLQKTPPQGEELEKLIITNASANKSKTTPMVSHADNSLDPATISEKQSRFESLTMQDQVVFLSEKQRDRLSQIAGKSQEMFSSNNRALTQREILLKELLL